MMVRMPRGMMERKPAHGAPCTRCGACCAAALCDLAKHVFGPRPGPCPALLLDADDRSACGLVEMSPDEDHANAALQLISAGDGCDARFNGEPVNRAFHAYQAGLDVKNADAIKTARRVWGIS